MRSIRHRIEKLESGWSQASEGGIHLFVKQARMEFALDAGRCEEILRQSGFLRSGPSLSVIRLLDIPWGLNAHGLEVYLRAHGASICGPRGAAKVDVCAILDADPPESAEKKPNDLGFSNANSSAC
jgi:hypothetical protein